MISVPEGEIAVLDFGDPERPVDVIFSNGNGFNALCHRQALTPLADRMRIIAADQRGHGLTRLPVHPEGRRDWWDLSRDLIALMQGLRLDRPVVLAGHSMGGTISLMTAQTVGDRVGAAVAFDPVIGPAPVDPDNLPPRLQAIVTGALRRRTAFDSRAAAFAAYKGRGIFATWPDEVLADYLEDGFRDTAAGVELTCSPAWEVSNYLAQAHDGRRILLTAALPTHVLKAGIVSTCQVAIDEPAVRANPFLRIEAIEGATHCLPMERPDLVQQALMAAVGGSGSSSDRAKAPALGRRGPG
jgi:pimeloyl-ACP methyl ester carboxylesterase